MISQVQANQGSALCARILALCEDTTIQLNLASREIASTIAKLEGRPSVTCERCRLSVPVDALGKKDRCVDAGCPLNNAEQA